MKTNFQSTFIAVLSGFLLYSCAPALYTNVGQNVPLLKEKGEFAIAAGRGSTGNDHGSAEGFNTQVAFAVGKSTAVISSFYSMKSSGGEIQGNGNYFEIGIGKFKGNEETKFMAEIFGGTGFGSIQNSVGSDKINLKYVKPFIQPSCGFSTKVIDIAFTARMALVSYTGKSENISDAQQRQSFDNFWIENKTSFVFEPGVTFRLGYQNIKLQLQYAHTSLKYEWPDGSDHYSAVFDDYGSVGVFILLSDRWKKSESK